MKDILIENIKKAIDENGLKHLYVAGQMGIRPQVFSNMLNGRTSIKADHIILLCSILKKTPNELFGHNIKSK